MERKSQNKELRLKNSGFPSLKELKNSPGFPDREIQKRKKLAVIECVERIPCNPCEEVCPFDAIKIDKPITNLPSLDIEKCRGCGQCISACPGLAIFMINYNYTEDSAAVSFPYEFIPYPDIGEVLTCVDRRGKEITVGKVLNIATRGNKNTAVVTVEVPKKYGLQVRSIKYNRGVEND